MWKIIFIAATASSCQLLLTAAMNRNLPQRVGRYTGWKFWRRPTNDSTCVQKRSPTQGYKMKNNRNWAYSPRQCYLILPYLNVFCTNQCWSYALLCFALLGGFTRRGKVHVKQSMSTIHNYPPRHFMVRRITPQSKYITTYPYSYS